MSTPEHTALAAFDQTPESLARLLAANGTPFPEFAAARADLAAFRDDARTRAALAETAPLLRDLDNIPATTYSRDRAFARVGEWWGKDHTYSGDSANLSLSLTPGGCWCERRSSPCAT